MSPGCSVATYSTRLSSQPRDRIHRLVPCSHTHTLTRCSHNEGEFNALHYTEYAIAALHLEMDRVLGFTHLVHMAVHARTTVAKVDPLWVPLCTGAVRKVVWDGQEPARIQNASVSCLQGLLLLVGAGGAAGCTVVCLRVRHPHRCSPNCSMNTPTMSVRGRHVLATAKQSKDLK